MVVASFAIGCGGATDSTDAESRPIDTSQLPVEQTLGCEGPLETLPLKLPCRVGLNLFGAPEKPGFHVTECEVATMPGVPALSFGVPLATLPQRLGEPIELPFEAPTPPASPSLQVGAESYAGQLAGIAVFSQVDAQRRTFVATLKDPRVSWTGDRGDSFACQAADVSLWAIAGDFL